MLDGIQKSLIVQEVYPIELLEPDMYHLFNAN